MAPANQELSAFSEGRRLYYEERDYAKALEHFLKVPGTDPAFATAQRIIGHNIYGRAWGRWSEGIPFLECALRTAPDDPKVLEDVGRAYVAVGRIKDGRDLLARAGTAVAEQALRHLEDGV